MTYFTSLKASRRQGYLNPKKEARRQDHYTHTEDERRDETAYDLLKNIEPRAAPILCKLANPQYSKRLGLSRRNGADDDFLHYDGQSGGAAAAGWGWAGTVAREFCRDKHGRWEDRAVSEGWLDEGRSTVYGNDPATARLLQRKVERV